MTKTEAKLPDPRQDADDSRLKIAIDATGLLTWHGALTGIQRVEDFMIRSALADPDPGVEVVTLDPSSHRFRPLESFELARFGADAVAPFRRRSRRPALAALRHALQAVRRYPMAKRDADRQLAGTIANGEGALSAMLAAALRAYRLWRRGCVLSGLARSCPEEQETAAPDSPMLLISNHVMVWDHLAKLSRQAHRLAFLCHDMIPAMRPDLVGASKIQAGFGANLEMLAKSGAAAFCTSATSARMLEDHMEGAGVALPAIHRFPMPSLLHAKADLLGTTSRIEGGEAFVLYCSTVEVRKNHILLARVWQQALEEGVALPKLVCAGRRGWMIEELDAYLKEHPRLAERVVFTGPISDEELIRRYRSASFGVFPSHIEGWGYAASECLDFGIPVIVSTTPSLVEATGGLMPTIDSTDQAGWYAAIRRMAEDGAWRSSLTERIAERHRPTSPAESWAAIKAGLRAAGAVRR